MTRWQNRIGEEGVEWLLTETIAAGKRSGAVKGSDLKRVTVDTTVMEKNIAHPTDARLFEAARRKLVGLAREAGIGLRQSHSRLAPRLAGQVGRYAHARQVRAATATPPAEAKSRSGRRLQRHLRLPNPGQGCGLDRE